MKIVILLNKNKRITFVNTQFRPSNNDKNNNRNKLIKVQWRKINK